jgi:enterochelin esterase-like enzyme/photosystem II stability/assembly factor-like uncharacterized protein
MKKISHIGAILAGACLINTGFLFAQHTIDVQRPGLGEYIWGIEAPDTVSCWAVAWRGIENFETAWVMRTTDGGASWMDVTPVAFDTLFVAGFHAPSQDTAFACVTNSGPSDSSVTPMAWIYRTTDGGATWEEVFMQPEGWLINVMMFNQTDGVGLGDPVGGKWTLLKTSDGGASWNRISTEPAQVGDEEALWGSFFALDSLHFWFGTSDPNRLYRTTDGGLTWDRNYMSLQYVYRLAFISAQEGVCAFGDQAIRTENGGITWLSTSPAGYGFIPKVVPTGTSSFWMARGMDIGLSKDAGTTWSLQWQGTIGSLSMMSLHQTGDSTAKGWLGSETGTLARCTLSMREIQAKGPGPVFRAFLDTLNAADIPDRPALVDSFLQTASSIPFVEEDTIATFLYQGTATSVNVPGDFNGWNQSAHPMSTVEGSNLWYRWDRFESDARLDYKFVLNGSDWILDPMNPNTWPGGYGLNSFLGMPMWQRPWEVDDRPGLPHGRLERIAVPISGQGVNYIVDVYLPPDYDNTSRNYPVAYFQDGGDYINFGAAINVLNNLIDSMLIEPIIAVFVTPRNRNEEYAFGFRDTYRLWFAEELVPHIDSLYRTWRSREGRAVMGPSFGGNISALITHYHPDVFSKCGLQSCAFWPNNYEAYTLTVNDPDTSVQYNLAWGSYEGSLSACNRDFSQVMLGAGADLEWDERPEGHSWGLWAGTTDQMLIHFFPGIATSVEEEETVPSTYTLSQNYPNPFNPATTIQYDLPGASRVTLRVYDILGREVAELVNGQQSAGRHTVRFNAAQPGGHGSALSSGVYIFQLRAGDYIATRKMMLVK